MHTEATLTGAGVAGGPVPRARLPHRSTGELGLERGLPWARGRGEAPAPECSTCGGRGRIEVKPGLWTACPSCASAAQGQSAPE